MSKSSRSTNAEIARKAIIEGNPNQALKVLESAVRGGENNAEIFNLIGQCLSKVGRHKDSLGAYRKANELLPRWTEPYLGAATSLQALGDAYAAMQALLKVLTFEPDSTRTIQQLVNLLLRLNPRSYISALEPALVACFSHLKIDPSPLSSLCSQQLRFWLDENTGVKDSLEKQAAKLNGNQLCLLYLSRTINIDPQFEVLLTDLRRHFLLNTDIEQSPLDYLPLIVGLAKQCFLNEHVFAADEAELKRLVLIDEHLKTENHSLLSVYAFALSCMYQPPKLCRNLSNFLEKLSETHNWLGPLCELTINQPLRELEIANALPSMQPIRDTASLQVKKQYEINPYPRWIAPPNPPRHNFFKNVRKRFSRRVANNTTKNLNILVAGCGTGFEPIDIARRESDAKIIALDLSRTSLAYAKQQAMSLECDNIEFIQGDILDLSKIGKQFDYIFCTGVLHHMNNPYQGWQVLREHLSPIGMMRISLYSAHARTLISMARKIIADMGLKSNSEDIRSFRNILLSKKEHIELKDILFSHDFYSMSGCRDLLFNVIEHQFILPDIQRYLDQSNLEFCGFDNLNPMIMSAFKEQFPEKTALTNLASWNEFEKQHTNLFSSMYQFWCESK